MNVRVPVYIQPVDDTILFLPTHFNSNEYDTLASLNLPMNENGSVLSGMCAKIPLGYRIILPRGCIGVMKERKSVVDETPFHVLSGILDCNTLTESNDLKMEMQCNELPQEMNQNVGEIQISSRHHPEVILYIHNCGTNTIAYVKGKALVQLFVMPVYESQVQVLSHSSSNPISVPLRCAEPKAVAKTII